MIMEAVISGLTGFGIGTFMFLCLYFGVLRNTAVLEMEQRVNNAAHNYLITFLNSLRDDEEFQARQDEWETMKKTAEAMRNRNGYNRMVFSLRPLTFEEWYTETECEIIKDYGNE